MTGHLSKGLFAAAFLSITIVALAGGCNHPRSTPEDATAVSHEVSQTLVGRQITIRGKFASLVKGDPYVVLDNQQACEDERVLVERGRLCRLRPALRAAACARC